MERLELEFDLIIGREYLYLLAICALVVTKSKSATNLMILSNLSIDVFNNVLRNCL